MLSSSFSMMPAAFISLRFSPFRFLRYFLFFFFIFFSSLAIFFRCFFFFRFADIYYFAAIFHMPPRRRRRHHYTPLRCHTIIADISDVLIIILLIFIAIDIMPCHFLRFAFSFRQLRLRFARYCAFAIFRCRFRRYSDVIYGNAVTYATLDITPLRHAMPFYMATPSRSPIFFRH